MELLGGDKLRLCYWYTFQFLGNEGGAAAGSVPFNGDLLYKLRTYFFILVSS